MVFALIAKEILASKDKLIICTILTVFPGLAQIGRLNPFIALSV
jgi:hypothetical protein